MEGLQEIVNCCGGLKSEKTTERKKASEQLSALLQRPYILKLLDDNTDSKSRDPTLRVFCWYRVFKSAFTFLTTESQGLEKAAGRNTSSVSRDKKRKDVIHVVKEVIRATDTNGHRLDCSKVVEGFVDILQNQFQCEHFGNDVGVMLLKNVLSVRRYWSQLIPTQWRALLKTFKKHMSLSPPVINPDTASRVLYATIQGATAQIDVRGSALLPFFTDYFNRDIRNHRSLVVVKYILSAMNTLCKEIASNARHQVCKLGEQVFTSLMYYWGPRGNESLKGKLTEFFCLQLAVHHPGGALTEAEGGYAADWNVWKSSLRKLYEGVYQDISQLCTRFASSTRNMPKSVNAEYLLLASRVFHQLFSWDVTEIEVTQCSFLNSTQSCPAAKKRKLQSGWSALCDQMVDGGNKQLSPWLQLVEKMLVMYPNSLSEDDALSLTKALQHVLSESKKLCLSSAVMRCLSALSHCQQMCAEKWDQIVLSACEKEWQDIWTATLRCVTLQHAVDEGFGLLGCLIRTKKIEPVKDIWSIFRPSLAVCTSSVQFLSILLSYCHLPENYQPDVLTLTQHTANRRSFPLRQELIKWLLPDKEELTQDTCQTMANVERLDPKLMADTLTLLTMNSESMASVCTKKMLFEASSSLEISYLQSTFNEPCFSQVAGSQQEKPYCNIPVLCEQVFALLVRDCKLQLNIIESGVCSLEELLWYCFLTASWLVNSLKHHAVSGTDLEKNQLAIVFKKVIFKSCEGIMRSFETEAGRVSHYVYTLQCILCLEDCCEGKPVVTNLCRTATPLEFIRALMDKVSMINKVAKTSNASSGSVSHQVLPMDNDDFDLDVSEANSDCVDDLDAFDSQEGTNHNPSEAWHSLFSYGTLSDSQQVRVECARLLCAWSRPTSWHEYRGRLSPEEVCHNLLDICAGNTYDVTKPADLNIVHITINEMSKFHNTVSFDAVEKMLTIIKVLLKSVRQDQEVFCDTICLLSACVMLTLGNQDNVDQQVHCRQLSLKLLKGICQIHMKEESQMTCRVRRALSECCLSFLQVDPECQWAYFPVEGGETKLIASILIDLLADAHHDVRQYTALHIKSLFVKDSAPVLPLKKDLQNDRFDTMYTALTDCTDIQGVKMDSDEIIDERTNRSSSMLCSLKSVCTHSIVCEHKALCACLLAVLHSHVDMNVVHKVVKQVSVKLGYPDMATFITSHLPYLVHQWLDVGNTIDTFPFQFLDCASLAAFLKEHHQSIIPLLVMREDLKAIAIVAERMQLTVDGLLTACIPRVMVHILPLFAVNKSGMGDSCLKDKARLANRCYTLLEREVTKQAVETSIASSLSELVVDILMTLHDSRTSDPDPNPPVFNKTVILTTLDYLTQCHGNKAKSLVSLLAKTMQDGIQKVLLCLRVRIAAAHRLHHRYRIVNMYSIFVNLLLKEFHEDLGGSWAFVLQDVVYTLVNVVKSIHKNSGGMSYDCAIFCICCDLMTSLCKVCLETCPQELCRFLAIIVDTVIPFVTDGDHRFSEPAKQLIDLLGVENANTLKSALIYLNPYPSVPLFEHHRRLVEKLKYKGEKWTLKMEIDHFLSSRQHKVSTNGEALRFLNGLIEKNMLEMTALVQECPDLLYQSSLVRLVLELVQLAHSGDDELSLEAACCLGTIGPVDMSVNAIVHETRTPALSRCLEAYSHNKDMQRNCTIFHKLSGCLGDKCVDVVVAASDALSKMLSTKCGQSFVSDYNQRMPNDTLFLYLHPFKSKKRLSMRESNSALFVDIVGDPALWSPERKCHGEWIKGLTSILIDSGGVTDDLLRLLQPICINKPSFCEEILPFVIHDIIRSGGDSYRQLISQQMTDFFSTHCGLLKISSSRVATPLPTKAIQPSSICFNKKSVDVMLNVVQYLRLQNRHRQGRQILTPWDNNFWLDLNYLQIAKAAQSCGQHFSSVMFTEIWWDRSRQESGSQRDESQGSNSSFQSMLCSDSTDSLSMHTLLLEAYRSIGDPDAVYGCGAGKIADSSIRIQTYEHENEWSKALGVYDAEMLAPDPTLAMQTGILQAIQHFGSQHILATYMLGLSQQNLDQSPEVEECKYEAAWRMGKWDLDGSTHIATSPGFNKCLHSAVCAMLDLEGDRVKSSVECARRAALSTLREHSVQSIRTIYPVISRLTSVATLEHIAHQVLSKSDMTCCSKRWDVQDQVASGDFIYLEPFRRLRCVLIGCLLEKSFSNGLHIHLVHQLESLAKQAREASQPQIAEQALGYLKQRKDMLAESSVSWRLEESKLFWARGEVNTAIYQLKRLISQLDQVRGDLLEAALLYPHALGLYGSWVAETRSENPNIIMDDYLDKAVNMLESLGDTSTLDAYFSLARFADSQYQHLANYTKSSTYEAKKDLVEKAKLEAIKLKALGDRGTRYLRTLEGQSVIDEAELLRMSEDKKKFLVKSVENYFKCLQKGDSHDLRVFRLTSLWFENAKSDEINNLIKDEVKRVQSYKFLPLMYQLAARLSTTSGGASKNFQPTLQSIIGRCATEHPYHTLNIVLALANANKDELVKQPANRKKLSTQQSDGMEQDRVKVAKQLLDNLRSARGRMADIIHNMEVVCEMYIQLANLNVDAHKEDKKPIPLSSKLMMCQIRDMPIIPVFTVDMKVDTSCEYKDIVYIQGFGSTYRLVGGLNLPKIVTCRGSDGLERKQLVKGKDDLRQDAVMEQVFGLVNEVLRGEAESHKRRLTVRTYKVIPLSQRSGLLEWCEGTTPIGQYLVGGGGEKGAHERYRPGDWSALDCRKEMTKARKENCPETLTVRLMNTFTGICENHFKPVFRHFFLEKFLDPPEWYERRLAYTRSVATNSIVGYILGLGDRHVQNILIDCHTAQLIHIDLGIAFEQGKLLPTPETIPFRLTRDIVDGMGVTGVEGVFRRCCEKTMEVLRQSQEALMTILQVLLYDPLYAWTLSPQRAFQLQQLRDGEQDTNQAADIVQLDEQDNAEKVNKMAERALLRLHQKLQGVEEGLYLSVSGQVNLLIQEARDMKNLSRLFAGWQPYL